jgi:hypothetical protein
MVLEPGTILGIDRGRAGDRKNSDGGDGEPSHVNLLGRLSVRMSATSHAINLQFGQTRPSCQDVTEINQDERI